jgi:hypothetical protein
LVDVQGWLLGKRSNAVSFVETRFKSTYRCSNLMATYLEMATPDVHAPSNGYSGCGDYAMAQGPNENPTGAGRKAPFWCCGRP